MSAWLRLRPNDCVAAVRRFVPKAAVSNRSKAALIRSPRRRARVDCRRFWLFVGQYSIDVSPWATARAAFADDPIGSKLA